MKSFSFAHQEPHPLCQAALVSAGFKLLVVGIPLTPPARSLQVRPTASQRMKAVLGLVLSTGPEAALGQLKIGQC